MSDGLLPALRSLKQKEFYAEPRFHASFAWALLHRPAAVATTSEASSSAVSSSSSTKSVPLSTTSGDTRASTTAPQGSADAFPTIARFPPTVVPSLNAKFGETLRARHVGAFDVREVHVRIGKEVFRWALSGDQVAE